jgi:hypothetical protein
VERKETTPPPLPLSSPSKARPLTGRELLARDIDARHAAARERARAAEAAHPFTDPADQLAATQREASERAAASLPAVAVARSPAAAWAPETRAAVGLPVRNRRVWEADLTPVKGREKPPAGTTRFLERVRSLARARVLGDVLAPTIVRAGELIAYFVAVGTGDVARVTHATLAKKIGCCVETVRKIVRFLEARGALHTVNVSTWGDEGPRRGANLYIMRVAETAADDTTHEAALTRFMDRFGLRRTTWGFNKAVDGPRQRPHPSPG